MGYYKNRKLLNILGGSNLKPTSNDNHAPKQ